MSWGKERAAKIQSACVTHFFNPKTGVLADEKDTETRSHDHWFLFINNMVITYGWVPEASARSAFVVIVGKAP